MSDIGGAFILDARFLGEPLKVCFEGIHITVLEYVDEDDALVESMVRSEMELD